MPRLRYDPGSDRQRLNLVLVKLSKVVRVFCSHEPLLNAQISRLRRRCGKPRCRCTRGKLHESVVLVDRTARPRTIRKVPPGLLKALAKPTARDRSFRHCLSQLASLSKEARGCARRLRLWRLKQGLQWFRNLKKVKAHA